MGEHQEKSQNLVFSHFFYRLLKRREREGKGRQKAGNRQPLGEWWREGGKGEEEGEGDREGEREGKREEVECR